MLNSIGKKIILGVIVVFLVGGSIFIYYAHKTGYRLLEESARHTAHNVAIFSKTILEKLMINGENEKLHETLENLIELNQAYDVMVMREDGTIAIQFQRGDSGTTFSPQQLKEISINPQNQYFIKQDGDSLFQYLITPIQNRQECLRCHESSKGNIGYLAVKISMNEIRKIADSHRTTNIIMTIIIFFGLAVAIVIMLVILIIRPVKILRNQISTLENETEHFERGEQILFSKIKASKKQDEIGDLINAFNALIHKLNKANEKLIELNQIKMEHADRLATSGQMAASIAHEIKNPTAGVLGALKILREELYLEPDKIEIFDEMITQLERINNTVNDLLSYARPTSPEFTPVDLTEIMKKTISLMSKTGNSAIIKTSFSDKNIIIEADKKQLQQVIWNVMLNAQDALDTGGEIILKLEDKDDFITITITDNGKGIPEKEIESVFKPFYSMKHKGTGLGMTITKRIIEQHNGSIRIQSKVGTGTTVYITLPKLQKKV